MPAPETFSLVHNPVDVLRYFSDAHKQLAAGHDVRFDLSEVKLVTPDAIALLTAKVHDPNFKRHRRVSGVGPKDPVAEQMFRESGFYEHVAASTAIGPQPSNMLLHYTTNNRVENIVARDAARLAVKHVFGDGRRLPPVYETLIECMANTNNHASLSRRGSYDWWLSVYNDPKAPRSVFTFLDLGVGVFRSLPVQRFWTSVAQKLGISRNVDLVPQLFAGEISSRTGQSERGKGIPRIHEHATGGTFRSAYMISNDVFVDFQRKKYDTLTTPFGGTFYCFELVAATPGAP